MNNYCVYVHIFPNSKKYVGITCQKPEKRWRNGKGYKENKHLNNAINKYGWNNINHVILKNNLNKEEAEQFEIYYINKIYKSNITQNGYNKEIGGCHNGKTSLEIRKKQSEKAKGQHRSPQTEFKKGHIVIITEEIKKKISQKNKGKHASIKTEFKKGHKGLNNRKVICLETKKIYNSLKEAYQDVKVMDCHISEVCRGIRKTAGKMHWKYVED